MKGSEAQIAQASEWLKPKLNDLVRNFTGTNISPIKDNTQRLKNGDDIPLTRDSSRNTGISIRIAKYSVDNPEEVHYHLGKLVKFVSGDLPEAEESFENDGEPETEEQLTFRQQVGRFLSDLKPVLIQGAKEVWYSKEDLKRMREGKEAGPGRISKGTVKFDKPKETPA